MLVTISEIEEELRYKIQPGAIGSPDDIQKDDTPGYRSYHLPAKAILPVLSSVDYVLRT